MDDLLEKMKVVVDRKGFDQRLKSDYEASLIARFNNLCVGSKGKMLNCRNSVKIEELLDKKVILELDDLKSPEDKSFIMGLIIARVSEAVKEKHKTEPDFKHITLIEEAHRLLEMPGPGEGGPKKHAVGMFTDLLAEVRKYGESLVIVDQIPNKLASEVMKNTNIKIIHKLFAKDDREAVGDTIGLSKEQKEYLSSLRTGEAVIYSGDWSKSVFAKIKMLEKQKDVNEQELEDLVKKKGKKQIYLNKGIYFPELDKEEIDFNSFLEYISCRSKVMNHFVKITKLSIKEVEKDGEIPPLVEPWIKNCGVKLELNHFRKEFFKYLYKTVEMSISPDEIDNLSDALKDFRHYIDYLLIKDKDLGLTEKEEEDFYNNIKDILKTLFKKV
jgi:hypothetical protein